MTAFAFILGCIPLWTATGAGGISRQVLGTVVIGGMLAATLIAIFIIPVTFAVVERLTHRFSTRVCTQRDAGAGTSRRCLMRKQSIAVRLA